MIDSLNEEKQTLEKKSLESSTASTVSQRPALPAMRRLESMGGMGKIKSRFDFNQRVLLGDRGLSSGFKEIFRKLMADNGEARHARSLTLMRKINENHGSAFNRYMASKRAQNEDFLSFLSRKQTDFNEVIMVSSANSETEGEAGLRRVVRPREARAEHDAGTQVSQLKTQDS